MSFHDDLRQRLGIADDSADEATILAALDEALAEQETAGTTPDPAGQPVASVQQLPEGVVTIDADQLAQLQADARQGREARDEQRRNHREQVVNAAVADGRIAPARREAWLAQLEADPGAEQVLASLAKGTVPLAETGFGAAPDLTDDDAIYASLYGKEA